MAESRLCLYRAGTLSFPCRYSEGTFYLYDDPLSYPLSLSNNVNGATVANLPIQHLLTAQGSGTPPL